MKKWTFILAFSIAFTSLWAQNTTQPDSLGLPGDNLNLYAVLDLFSKSETFEVFEQKLNEENTKINNLDLNNDGKIDYIRVIDNKDGDNHAIVLQTPVTEKENQDLAVIELEKTSNGQYNVQIIGNEDLYGKDYIVEPSPEAVPQSNVNPAYENAVPVYVAPAQWPIIVYVYRPAYVVYASPWRWGYYPARWRPWRPLYYHGYYSYWRRYPHYHQYYHRTAVYRSPMVHSYYGPRRSTSTVVVQNKSQGAYRNNYRGVNNSNGNNGSRNPGYQQGRQRTNTSNNNRHPAKPNNSGNTSQPGTRNSNRSSTGQPRIRNNGGGQNRTPGTTGAPAGRNRGGGGAGKGRGR